MSKRIVSPNLICFILILLSQLGCEKDVSIIGPKNHPPAIQSVTSSPKSSFAKRIPCNTRVTLSVVATDAERDDLKYTWYVERGSILSGVNASTAFWQPPVITSDENETIRITVSDGIAIDIDSIMVFLAKLAPITSPVLLSPADLQVDVPPNTRLAWKTNPGAVRYAIQVAVDSLFYQLVLNTFGYSDTSYYLPGLAYNQTYYWRVKVSNDYDGSDWSETRRFTTLPRTYLEGHVYYLGTRIPVPYASILLDPPGRSTVVDYYGYFRIDDLSPGTVTLRATRIGYDDYTMSIRLPLGRNSWDPVMTSASFTHGVLGTVRDPGYGLTLEGVTVTLLNGDGTASQITAISDRVGQYRLSRVPAGSRLIRFSKSHYKTLLVPIEVESSDYRLDTALALKPAVPSSPNPPDNSPDENPYTAITLSWNCTDPDGSPLRYDIYFGAQNPPTLVLRTDFAGNRTSTGPLVQGETYYWNVVAKTEDGNVTNGPIWRFTTRSTPCSGQNEITYAGKVYHIISIGNQCWLQENLDAGIMIADTQIASDNGVFEKFCYRNDPAYCAVLGGLYQWNEAMQYATAPGTQGICPAGWHIPTTTDFINLSVSVGGDARALKAVGEGSGAGAGTNTSGFSALLAGIRSFQLGTFSGLGEEVGFWASTTSPYPWDNWNPHFMNLFESRIEIFMPYDDPRDAFSVRCLRN